MLFPAAWHGAHILRIELTSGTSAVKVLLSMSRGNDRGRMVRVSCCHQVRGLKSSVIGSQHRILRFIQIILSAWGAPGAHNMCARLARAGHAIHTILHSS